MKQPYSGNAKPYVLALFSSADAERVTPVLEELDARGYDLCGQDGKVSAGRAKRACAVVVFLTERFAADEAARKQMYALLGAAAVVLIVAGVLIWRTVSSRSESVPALSEATVVLLESYGITEEDLANIRDVVIVGEHFAYYTEETRPDPYSEA